MSRIPTRPSSSGSWSPPGVPPVLAAVSSSRQPPQSAGRGFRVLHALLHLGARDEHQLAEIARAAGLQPSHASKLLKAAAAENLVERGTRRGTYRLTRESAPLAQEPRTPASTPTVRRIVEDLQQETEVAAAWHEPHFRVGLGLHLTLVDMACPQPELRTAAAQQDGNLRTTAAGRAVLAYAPSEIAVGPDDLPLTLPPATQDTIRSTRIALRRYPGVCTLATPVLRGQHLVGVLSVTGDDRLFQDPLRAQEFAVLLRRAAGRAAGPLRQQAAGRRTA
ncbi:IclR family transcriptional regulator [Streptomyces marianii]|uniref:Helix-turn-helix domain-containing protein n=1 Tax=Streptomyces marianii TaxID=1817406 RepID=A0A5R9DU42_9ACTN|nr:hypothetical protein [Streptomyces marianii]TLQ39274.1 hypothetical protein FEF34_38425 [Streptomyces marianii]